jgi:hypothetical protein
MAPKELLIVEEHHRYVDGGWTLLRHISVGIILAFLALAAVRSELKCQQLESRIIRLELMDVAQDLEAQQLKLTINEKQDKVLLKRDRREANPDPEPQQWSHNGQPRSQYDPHQRRTSTHLMNIDDSNLRRHDEEETYFTKSARDGSYVRPTGLKEMYERLPPIGHVQQPPPPQRPVQRDTVELRAGYQNSPQFLQPPVQQVGSTSARVVRYDDKEELIAAHFVADVSNFTSNENPRLRNANGIFQIWRPAGWMDRNMQRKFEMEAAEGVVKVVEGGMYQIYAQIHYHDNQPNSFIVEVNGEPLLQCSTVTGLSSCFTSGLAKLRSWDRIVVKNVGVDRFSIYKPEKSFFGLIKMD